MTNILFILKESFSFDFIAIPTERSKSTPVSGSQSFLAGMGFDLLLVVVD